MTVEDVVRTHTEGFNRALTTHDLDALSAIYADDYMLVRPDGSVLGKEDVLRDLGAGGLRFTSIDLANVSEVDATGLDVLVYACRAATAAHVKLVLCSLPQLVIELLEPTRLSEIGDVDIEPTMPIPLHGTAA